MAEALKVLGQAALAATTLTSVYTVPADTSAVVSTFVICNRSTATTFRVAVSPAGAAIDNAHYIFYDVTLPANDSFVATIGGTLATTDIIRFYAGSANVSVTVFGSETT